MQGADEPRLVKVFQKSSSLKLNKGGFSGNRVLDQVHEGDDDWSLFNDGERFEMVGDVEVRLILVRVSGWEDSSRGTYFCRFFLFTTHSMPFRVQFWQGDPVAALQRTLAIWHDWQAFWALPERNMDGRLVVVDILACSATWEW